MKTAEKLPPPKAKMGRPRTFDTEVALATAMDLFWKYGYDGVTTSMLAEEMGINRPSLQAAFGTKDDLFRTVLDRYARDASAYVQIALDMSDTRAAIRAYLEGAANNTTRVRERSGCLVTLGATIGPPESAPMRQEVAELRKDAEASLRRKLQQGQRVGHIAGDADTVALASFLVTFIYGNAMRAKEGHTRKELQRTIELVMNAIPFTDPPPEQHGHDRSLLTNR